MNEKQVSCQFALVCLHVLFTHTGSLHPLSRPMKVSVLILQVGKLRLRKGRYHPLKPHRDKNVRARVGIPFLSIPTTTHLSHGHHLSEGVLQRLAQPGQCWASRSRVSCRPIPVGA